MSDITPDATQMVSSAEEPTITLNAADYSAARALVNIMEAELDTIKQDAEYAADIILKTLRTRREATAVKFLAENKMLACVAAADRDKVVQGLMAEFDQSLSELKESYEKMLQRFTEQKRKHLIQLRELLLFDGLK